MPIVGEEFIVTDVVTDEKGAALTDADGITVTLYVDDPDGVRVVDGEAMAYDATDEWWYFVWNTVLLIKDGTYRGKAVVTFIDGGKSFEKPVKWRLAADTMPVP